ncbi:MAG: hypothetical protein R3B13_17205 [Polyangiaceae bacterium]
MIRATFMACVLVCGACSGSESSDNPGDAGTADVQTDGTNKPPAQGGLSLSVDASSSPPSGASCTIQAHTASIGQPPPDAANPGGRVVDGQDGASVTCAVRPSASGFDVTGIISRAGISFGIQGKVAADGTGTADVTYFDPASAITLKSPASTPCQLSAPQASTVSAGRIWAGIQCPGLAGEATPALYCAGQGHLILENCDTQ